MVPGPRSGMHGGAARDAGGGSTSDHRTGEGDCALAEPSPRRIVPKGGGFVLAGLENLVLVHTDTGGGNPFNRFPTSNAFSNAGPK